VGAVKGCLSCDAPLKSPVNRPAARLNPIGVLIFRCRLLLLGCFDDMIASVHFLGGIAFRPVTARTALARPTLVRLCSTTPSGPAMPITIDVEYCGR